MSYAQVLKKVVDAAKPVVGASRSEIEDALKDISALLKGPMSNAERILLCEERASLKKALAAADCT